MLVQNMPCSPLVSSLSGARLARVRVDPRGSSSPPLLWAPLCVVGVNHGKYGNETVAKLPAPPAQGHHDNFDSEEGPLPPR